MTLFLLKILLPRIQTYNLVQIPSQLIEMWFATSIQNTWSYFLDSTVFTSAYLSAIQKTLRRYGRDKKKTIDCDTEGLQVSQVPSVDYIGFFAINHLALSPKRTLWLLGLAMEMLFVYLPWQLGPVGKDLVGVDVVSIWPYTWAYIQPYIHYQQCYTSAAGSIVEAVQGQC